MPGTDGGRIFLAISLLLGALAAAIGGVVVLNPGSLTLTGGRTETISTEQLGSIMLRNLIVPSTTGDATVANLDLNTRALTVDMPITGGEINPRLFMLGQIQHTGGLKFTRPLGLRSLTVSNFKVVIDIHPHIMVTVDNDPAHQVSLLSIQTTNLRETNPAPNELNLDNVGVTLTHDGAALLNRSLGVTDFTEGLKFATVNTHTTHAVNS